MRTWHRRPVLFRRNLLSFGARLRKQSGAKRLENEQIAFPRHRKRSELLGDGDFLC